MSAPARKESILDLKMLVERRVHVKLAGGREGNDDFTVPAVLAAGCTFVQGEA